MVIEVERMLRVYGMKVKDRKWLIVLNVSKKQCRIKIEQNLLEWYYKSGW